MKRWAGWPWEGPRREVFCSSQSGRMGLQILEQKSCLPISPSSEGFGFVAELLLLNLLFHPGGVLIDNCLLFQILLV